jgi:uncharacterized protein YgbK (DUF1537 family)
MTRIAVIADDLTGALDTVSPFAERGMRTAVFVSSDRLDIASESETEVIAVNTESRHLLPRAAADRAAHAARLLKDWKPEIVLKKIDSRLKGNVGAEAAAIARVIGARSLVVAPAAPDVGRIVIRGKVTGAGVGEPIDVAAAFAGCGLDVVVPDAGSGDELAGVAASAVSDASRLFVCSRGLAKVLAGWCPLRLKRRQLEWEEPILLAIGTRDPMTITQIDHLVARGGFSRIVAEQGRFADTLVPNGRIVIQCAGEKGEPGELVASRFASGIADRLKSVEVRTLLLSGGDTAAAVMRALDIRRVTVCGEAQPGLPWFMIPMAGQDMTVICKSGGFGGPDALLHLFPVPPAIETRRVISHGL